MTAAGADGAPLPSASPRGTTARAAAGPLLLVALGVVRILRLVLHDPLLGYADNYDFHRIANWYGWMPADPHVPVLGGHVEAPLALYSTLGARAPELWSSSLFYMEVVAQLHRLGAALGIASPSTFDIRLVGATRALVLAAAAFFIVWRLTRASRGAAWGVAAFFAVVVADPSVTLYANTLYGDFDAVSFLFVASAALVWVHAAPRPTTAGVATVAAALFLLGAIKPQHAALPLAMLVAAAITGLFHRFDAGRRTRILIACLVLAATAPIPLELRVLSGRGPVVATMKVANSANAWFGAILPSFDDPRAALARLGLPRVCEKNIGKSWYDEHAETRACRKVGSIPRSRMVAFLAREPHAALRLLDGALRETFEWAHGGLGQIEGRRFGRIDGLEDWSLWNLEALPHAVGVDRYVIAMKALLAACAGVLGTVFVRALLRRPATSLASAVAAIASVTVLYGLVSSVFGDGYVEVTKHFLLGRLALFPALGVLLASAVRGIGRLGHELAHRASAAPEDT